MPEAPLVPLLLLLALCLPVLAVARRLRAGALAGYLAAGVLAGILGRALPGLGLGSGALQPFADAGASMLVFAIGLELDLGAMRRRLGRILAGGLLQVGLTTLAGAAAVRAMGLGWAEGLAIGACLSMTSTLVLMRGLEERGLRHREEGRVVIGLSLFQDVAIAPLLVLIALAAPAAQPRPLWQLAAGVAALAVGAVLLRRFLASRLMARLRLLQVPEAEVAFAVLLALGAALGAERLGLGAAVGAFCAGLGLGGGEHRTAVGDGIRPLQGVLAIVFFATMGTLFDPAFVWRHLGTVAAALAIGVTAKALLAALALRLARLPWRSALGAGIIIGSLGEFSFILAAAAFDRAGDPRAVFLHQLVVTVTCLGLVAAPLLIRLAEPLLPRNPVELVSERGATIVIAGLGPVGNTVVQALRKRGHPLLLIDRNPRLLAPWEGTPGIRTRVARIEDMEDWLLALGHRPAAVVLTFPVADTSALVATRLCALDPDLVIVARSPYQAQVDFLHASGVRHVICDESATAAALAPLLDEVIAR